MKKIVATMMLSAIALNLFSNQNMVQAEESVDPTSESSTFYSPSEAGKVLDEKKNEDLIKNHSKLKEKENFEFATSLGTLSDLVEKAGGDLNRLRIYTKFEELLLKTKKIYDETFQKHAVRLTEEREVYYTCDYKALFGTNAEYLKKDGKFDKERIDGEMETLNTFYLDQYKPVGQLENDNSDVAITFSIPRHTKVLLYKNIEGKNMLVTDLKNKGLKIVKRNVIHQHGKEVLHLEAKLIEGKEYIDERSGLISSIDRHFKEKIGIPKAEIQNNKKFYFNFGLSSSINDKAFQDLFYNGVENKNVEGLIKKIFNPKRDQAEVPTLTLASRNPVFTKYFDQAVEWPDETKRNDFKDVNVDTPILMVQNLKPLTDEEKAQNKEPEKINRMLVNINSHFWKTDGGEGAFLYWLAENSITSPEAVGLEQDFFQSSEFKKAATTNINQKEKSLNYEDLPRLFEIGENNVRKTIEDPIELYRAAFTYFHHSDERVRHYLFDNAPNLFEYFHAAFNSNESEA